MHRDPEDQDDHLFNSLKGRALLEKLILQSDSTPVFEKDILHGTPIVEVVVKKHERNGSLDLGFFVDRSGTIPTPPPPTAEESGISLESLFRDLSFLPAATHESIASGQHSEAPFLPMVKPVDWGGRDIKVMPRKNLIVSCAAFTHDGNRVLVESGPGVLELWDLRTNLLVLTHRLVNGAILEITRAEEPGWMLVAATENTYQNYIYRFPVVPGRQPECLWACSVHPDESSDHPLILLSGLRAGSSNGEFLIEPFAMDKGAVLGEDGMIAKILPEKGELQLVPSDDVPKVEKEFNVSLTKHDGEVERRARVLDRLGQRELLAITTRDPSVVFEQRLLRWEGYPIFTREAADRGLREVGANSPLVTIQDISETGDRLLVRLANPTRGFSEVRTAFIDPWVEGYDQTFESISLVDVNLRTLESKTVHEGSEGVMGVYTKDGSLVTGTILADQKVCRLSRIDSTGNVRETHTIPLGRYSPFPNTSVLREIDQGHFDWSFADEAPCDISLYEYSIHGGNRCPWHAGFDGGRYSISFSFKRQGARVFDDSGCKVVSRSAGRLSAYQSNEAVPVHGGQGMTLRFARGDQKGEVLTGVSKHNQHGVPSWGTGDGDRILTRFSPSGNRFFVSQNGWGPDAASDQYFQLFDLEGSRLLFDSIRHTQPWYSKVNELGIIDGDSLCWVDEDCLVYATEDSIVSLSTPEGNDWQIRSIQSRQGSKPSRACLDQNREWVGVSRDNAVNFYSLDSARRPAHELSLYFDGDGNLTVVNNDHFYTGHSRDGASCSMVKDGRAYPFTQFDLMRNRPDVILRNLGADPSLIEVARLLREDRLRKMSFDDSDLAGEGDLPEITFEDDLPLSTTENRLSFAVRASDAGTVLDRIMVYSNGVPVNGPQGVDVSGENTHEWEGKISVPLLAGTNQIEISAVNRRGVSSFAESVSISSQAELESTLYVVTLGVNEYRQSEHNLNVAAKDAEDVVQFFADAPGQGWGAVETLCLTNEEVTKQSISRVAEFFSQADPHDGAILFLAGHGLLDDSYEYYFATSEIDFENPGDTGGVKFEELELVLSRCAALRKLGLIDTCHAGELDEGMLAEASSLLEANGVRATGFPKPRGKQNQKIVGARDRELISELFADLRRGSGATIIAASAGAEFSLESDDLGNGIFTHAVLRSLRDKAGDENQDGRIDVRELRRFVEREAKRLTGGLQNPSSRRFNLVNPFVIIE